MKSPNSISMYLRVFANELGERILESYPPLHGAQDSPSPLLKKLLLDGKADEAAAEKLKEGGFDSVGCDTEAVKPAQEATVSEARGADSG